MPARKRQDEGKLRGELYGYPLSPREREILELRGRGFTLTQVAWKLKRGYTTVCTHQRRAFVKLGARNIQNAIYILFGRGAGR